uniref:Peptidase M13 C-terminal domain-containing protein n=1 Tax=Photinus pyralis TaxID=7054 RepID=A0A1Y1MLF4_PHOPY
MNYGGIGFTIGHEITHGFDTTCLKLDKDGNFVDWWVSSTKEKFITKVQCMIDQYGNYSVPELGLNLNGFRTIEENIADNGGARHAYLGYNEWVRRNGKEPLLPALNYTDRQLFWISAANGWCANEIPSSMKRQIHNNQHLPFKFRINVPLSNTDYFAKDFNCRIGSNMNPVSKCEVWRSL